MERDIPEDHIRGMMGYLGPGRVAIDRRMVFFSFSFLFFLAAIQS